MAQIPISSRQVKRLKSLAQSIADDVHAKLTGKSTTSIERTVLRLYGVDGVNSNGTPLPNRLVEILQERNLLDYGVSRFFASATLSTGKNTAETARLIENGECYFGDIKRYNDQAVKEKEIELADSAIAKLERTRRVKKEKQQKNILPPQPWRYLIVATGNIYEDCKQAHSAVISGADIIAVIRSTAQSLLDYIPFGATTEGFGGTYATQENFKIMRNTLDEESAKAGRYIRLVNYASGLCMPEISACAALEDLDMLLNDSMYGILFRDINMKRTLIDQHFSRLICARAGIIINTGEDNYLTTSDAIEKAHTVTASQLINEAMAKKANLTEGLLGLGHVFEVDPKIKNALLYEIAHAQVARELFPNSPLKYMPPTKYKSTDIFYSHCIDTIFNLTSVLTNQGIHLTGILTEAIHTPFMQDRYQSISSVNYVFNTACDLSSEIDFKKDGFIAKRAAKLLDETEKLLNEIKEEGLMQSISVGRFADIKRAPDGGKGLDGVFDRNKEYSNPIIERLEKEGPVND